MTFKIFFEIEFIYGTCLCGGVDSDHVAGWGVDRVDQIRIGPGGGNYRTVSINRTL